MDFNNLLQGGTVLVLLGGLLAYFRNVPAKIGDLLQRLLITKINVYDDDEAFNWVRLWLSHRLKDTRSMSVFARKEVVGYDEPDKKDVKVYYTPAPGFYLFRFRGKWVLITRDRKESNAAGASDKPRESFVIKVFSRDVSVGKALVEEARAFAAPTTDDVEVRCLTKSWRTYWKTMCRIPKKPISTVVLPVGVAENLMTDVSKFLGNKNWYSRMGIAYKRGYLFYGPPGTGKTSLSVAMASEFGMSLSVLNLSTTGVNDTSLLELLSVSDSREIILIEDIDCAFEETTQAPKDGEKLTMSGLLNALDGVVSQEGRIVIMTTNHPEKLNPALIRPGRIDYRLCVDLADAYQARTLFLRFFPGSDHADRFAGIVAGRLGMAELQSELVRHYGDEDAVMNAVMEKF